MLTTAVIITFSFCCIINAVYWSILCISLNKSEFSKNASNHSSTVTVLVCSKNDSHRLKTLLQHLDRQVNVRSTVNVLIVNDFSDSYHSKNLSTLDCNYPIRIIKSKLDIPGKKAALTTGLSAIDSGIILLTDADCRPRPDWISSLSSKVEKETAVLGFSPFVKKASTVNSWARFENYITAIQYLGWAAKGKPYLGVGRSLGFHQQMIEQLTTQDLKPTIASGDDDMLVQYLRSAQPCLVPNGFVETESPETWKAYWKQKRRHYSISPSYALSHQIRLSLFSISQILIGVLGVTCLILKLGILPLTVWCVRIAWIALISRQTFNKLEQRDLWFLLPILDGLLSIYYLVFGLTFLLPKPKTW